MSYTEKQKRAQTACLAAIYAAFAAHGFYNLSDVDLRNPQHEVQNYPIAVRNGGDDLNGAVYEHVFEAMESMYDYLGVIENPATDFEYKVFNMLTDTPEDVLEFIAECDDPDEVLRFSAEWKKKQMQGVSFETMHI